MVSTANGGHSVARIDAASAQVPPLERRGEVLDLPGDESPGVSVAQVARRHALNANLIFKWLKDRRFAPADEVEPAVATAMTTSASSGNPSIMK